MKFYVFVWSFFGVIFILSIFHIYLWPHTTDPILFGKLNSIIIIRAIVIDEPDEKEKSTNLVLQPNQINGETLVTREKILARAPPTSHFQYGDEVEVRGKLELPQRIDADTGAGFNYPQYLAKDGIYYLINRAEVNELSSGHSNWIKRKLFSIKHHFLSKINKLLPEPHSGFMGGLLVAGKRSLPANLIDQFKRTGTLQVIVLSGYNLTIVAEFMQKVFSFLPRTVGLAAASIGIILFSIMTGGSSTIIRAAIMALIGIMAKFTHRIFDAKRALFMAGFLMVLQNPRVLLFDPSFQLSFLATLGLIVLSPYFERKLNFVPSKCQLRSVAAATLSSQIFVSPLILYQNGTISLVSLPANLLMMFFIPTLMLFGFLMTLSGFLNYFLALPFSFISYFLLSYELTILKSFSNLPFALLKLPFSIWFLIFTYAIYAIVYGVRSNRSLITRQLRLSKKASTYFFFSDGG